MPVTPAPAATIDPRSGSVNAFVPQQLLANAVAITDTGNHDPTTDAGFLYADCTELGGPKVVFVNSTLNAAMTIQLFVSSNKTSFQLVGTAVAVASGPTPLWIDQNTSGMAQLGQPYPYIGFQVKSSAGAPSSGAISVTLFARSA